MPVIDFCNKCGGPIYEDDTICGNCGEPYKSVIDLQPEPVEPFLPSKDGKARNSASSFIAIRGKWKYALVIALLILFAGLVTSFVMPGKTSRYEVIMKDCTWQEAFEESEAAGGHLVRIETEKELDTLTRLIDQEDPKLEAVLYILAARADTAEKYYWLNKNGVLKGKALNSESSFMANRWEEGEPSFSEYSNGDIDNRVVFVHKLRGYWKLEDVPDDMLSSSPEVSGKTGFIIEYE